MLSIDRNTDLSKMRAVTGATQGGKIKFTVPFSI